MKNVLIRTLKIFSRRSSTYYRPQTKFAKVMFLQVSLCPQGGACVAKGGGMCGKGGVHGKGGHAWWRGCVWQRGHVSWKGGVHSKGGCVCQRGHAWQRGVHSEGEACVTKGGMHGEGGGACVGYDEIRSMNGRYASYWNAFSLCTFVTVQIMQFDRRLKWNSKKYEYPPPTVDIGPLRNGG